jgi:PAS domain S-box-containing protein
MRKLFDHFIDSVTEIVRVGKMSVILKDRDCFRVKTHYGLDPYIAENLRIKNDSELIVRMKKSGRIMHKPGTFEEPGAVNIREEMELLQCVVSFPMMYRGKLIGIFNIDNKITEEPFSPEELEIIYVLCNYLAAAVKDIDLYHQVRYQKEFDENLISNMSSGIIAIDRERKITIFNRQASDILGLDPSDMIGRDFKVLPAPMGDILYDTMVTGTSYKRHEVSVNPSELPVGINSYRLMDEKKEPVGAGVIFTDLSDSRKTEEQNRRADHLKIVNDLIAKIAHEVRNPLTSIQTYTQLLNERSDDDELKNFFVSTVSQSIQNLDILIDKLVTFSSTQEYNFHREDLNDLMYGIADFVSKNIPRSHKFLIKLSHGPFYINADKKQLKKAVYYLVLSIIDRTPDGASMKMVINVKDQDISKAVISIKYSGESPLEKGEQELLKPLLDTDNLGTELNIPICSKIIEGHGGSLEIKSEDSVNTFVISLPVMYMKNDTLSIKGGHTSGE